MLPIYVLMFLSAMLCLYSAHQIIPHRAGALSESGKLLALIASPLGLMGFMCVWFWIPSTELAIPMIGASIVGLYWVWVNLRPDKDGSNGE